MRERGTLGLEWQRSHGRDWGWTWPPRRQGVSWCKLEQAQGHPVFNSALLQWVGIKKPHRGHEKWKLFSSLALGTGTSGSYQENSCLTVVEEAKLHALLIGYFVLCFFCFFVFLTCFVCSPLEFYIFILCACGGYRTTHGNSLLPPCGSWELNSSGWIIGSSGPLCHEPPH